MVAWLQRIPGAGRRGRRGGTDPFSTLEVQLALARLDHEIATLLSDDSDRFAKGHHLRAAQLAYEQALQEACRLAEVPALPEGTSLRRLMAEVELRARGWTW